MQALATAPVNTTVQLWKSVPVVYALPDHEPAGHVPPTTWEAELFTVNDAVVPSATT